GSSSDSPGLSRTSSKVSASRSVPLDFCSIPTPVARLAGLLVRAIADGVRGADPAHARAAAHSGLAPVDSTARPRILAICGNPPKRAVSRRERCLGVACSTAESGPPTRRRAVPFDRVHQLAVLAVLALHVDRNNGVQRRNEERAGKDEP